MKIRTSFPYETVHEDVRIPLPDGTRLYARVWRPLADEPVPALLEYLPHRLTDGTAPRDRQRHPWYAGHGYASVRVDVRGYGNSEGLPGDAYREAELADGVEVIGWLAGQPWCDGRVGMFGIGRGGSTALRVAARAPGPLRAVVAVCCADDRYDGDLHYWGGALLAAGTHSRAAAMLASAARPPDPLYVGDAWRRMWVTRLEAVEPLVHTWLAHPTRDDYWRTGALREEYGSVRAAVLAVGGWHDPYRDTVLRLVEHLPGDRVRGVLGPWSHQYPDREPPPGPAIGFLQETLRWWDHHLKDRPTGIMAEPLLRSWLGPSRPSPAAGTRTAPGSGTAPAPETPRAAAHREPAGRWVGDDAWPSPNVTPVTYALQGPPVLVRSPQHTGLDAGHPLPSGGDADLPSDQRAEDAHSACFDFPVPPDAAPLDILGRPRATLALSPGAPTGQVVARLCDVAPDGTSTLVTRGALDLTGAGAGARVVELSATGHTFPPGHRVRLAVSSAYWPWIWPRPDGAGFTLDPGASALLLPVRRPTTDTLAFEEPEQAEPLGVTVPTTLDDTETRRPERRIVRDVARGAWRLEVDPRHEGTRVHPDGLEVTEEALESWTITERDPLSAGARSTWTVRLHRPDLPWNVTVETRSEITCTATHFLTSDEVICKDGTEPVFHHTWERRVPRTAG
ncbi:CocE/NonD family hydrolase [Streptomyces sp. WAC05374]|uniref:CocE/NonD family hydrolase n=2 Tax=Streptomyces sp. WAC05374 TaxID=2487420 RepID=UPI0010551D96|nr:CocE/NonD family hydrolase [Streptomyces sp. WAC05374]TDF40477.1 CocE/NonD family hydrolase [Streptomyces sp. WAC05374]TDF49111.1 CocE/NonD family hydrolase [Streptomyces sp. WAC05374]TDF49597.1 CocE/NonD family hydrolase [Streptomyces sp. WAC05374]